MKYVSEFRNAELLQNAAQNITRLAAELVDRTGSSVRIMEVCGGHTHAIYRFGLKDILPPEVEFIHGPGCPVCVLSEASIDEGLELAGKPNVTLAMFGDMMRVPGKHGSPLDMKARGADIRMVYSPMDAVALAQKLPDREVVFFAIGFETTAPATVLALNIARREGLKNFSVFCNHILIAPPLQALLDSHDLRLDAFIGPGHVSTIIGCEPYEFIPCDYGKPVVVSGFEPLDLLHAVILILRQRLEGRCEVENQYGRAVLWKGNPNALRGMAECFRVRETFEWRGLGKIPLSGYAIAPAYTDFDAERKFAMQRSAQPDSTHDAPCGQVLRGAMKPHDCPLFGTVCTPETPVGALMVSSEGACAAYHQYAVPAVMENV